MRAVIYSKTIVESVTRRDLFHECTEVIERIEEAGQMYGWSQAIIVNDGEELNDKLFDELPEEAN